MNVYVLNKSFEQIAVIDIFKSLIWTKRYFTCGDFELCVPADESLLQYFKPDYFLMRDDDDSVMVIEKLEAQTDVENGDFFIVSGRSLESILSRRIVSTQTTVNESDVIQAIKKAISFFMLTVRNFSIDDSLTYPYNFSAQFSYNTLLDVVSSICTRFGIGFKITLSGSNMILSFYIGSEVDVVFSPEFDNMLNSKYVFDMTNYANAAMVMGEGQGISRQGIAVYRTDPQATGLDLRMIYVDARDISSNNGEIIGNDYFKLLFERGWEKLAEHDVAQSFEAEIEPQTSFVYKVDYNLGDIVTVTNEYGVTAKPRIVEIIESWDETGYRAIPTFDALEVVGKTILRDSEGFVLKDSTGAIITVKG